MYYNVLKISLIAIIMHSFVLFMYAQKTAIYKDADDAYKKAIELFEKQKYGLSAYEFDGYKEKKGKTELMISDAAYYSAMCAIELFNKDAKYMTLKFIGENPESVRNKYTYFNLGRYLYREKNYPGALNWFNKVESYNFLPEEQAEYNFKTGYCYFVTKNYDKAEKFFYEIKDMNNTYNVPATYFYSHISYTKGNYETALPGFEKLANDESFGTIVPYYITQILFLQEKYSEVINYAPSLLDSATTRRVPEIARIIGESYYKLEKYKEAIHYLEFYRERASDPTRSDFYELAYAYYKTGNTGKAIALLERITNAKDSLAQNSLYLLSSCYLTQGQKNMARIALQRAAKMDFDKFIKEEAMFNYAKLTYELSFSPFNEAITSLKDFISAYPQSPKLDEAYTLLGKVFAKTKNYKEAVEALENIFEVTSENEEAYQRVAFFRGLELYNNLNFENAIIHFDKSLNNSKYNQLYHARSIFWKAESYYRLNRIGESITLFNKFLLMPGAFNSNEFVSAYYNLGYCYYKDENYKQAQSWFRKFVDNQIGVKSKHIADALCRIGDCNFIDRNYDFAADYYTQAVSMKLAAVDYALFQKAFCLGLLKQNNEKVIVLNQLLIDYGASPYVDDALFELGKSYVTIDEKDMGINTFQKILMDYPLSDYVTKALIQIGLIHYNSDENEKAISMYRKVIEEYPASSDIRSAYLGLKNVYIDMNDVDKYYAYVKERGSQIDIRETEQDSLNYNASEKVYMSGDCIKANLMFDDYLKKFGDNGFFASNVYFYKAECILRATGNLSEAVSLYSKVLTKPRSVFTEPALLKLAKYEFDNKSYSSALDYFVRLETEAEYPVNILTAKVGKMRCHYRLGSYNEAIAAATQLIKSDKVSEELLREAHFTIGKSEYALNNLEPALEEFLLVARNCKSTEEAEAKYLICDIYFRQEQMDLAEKEIFDFVKKNTPQQWWLGKAFLLLADVYIKKPDYFQAGATLQSIIENYKPKDDGIVDDAKSKLDYIKLMEEKEKMLKSQENVVKPDDIEINLDKIE